MLAVTVLVLVLVLFVGVELVGPNNNATVDQISVMVDYVNQHFVAGDRIVTSDMLWYLSYICYNRTDVKPLLYTRRWPMALRAGRMPMVSARW